MIGFIFLSDSLHSCCVCTAIFVHDMCHVIIEYVCSSIVIDVTGVIIYCRHSMILFFSFLPNQCFAPVFVSLKCAVSNNQLGETQRSAVTIWVGCNRLIYSSHYNMYIVYKYVWKKSIDDCCISWAFLEIWTWNIWLSWWR